MGFVMSGGTCSLMLYAPGCMLRHVRARRVKASWFACSMLGSYPYVDA
jgi:hypothetical protein